MSEGEPEQQSLAAYIADARHNLAAPIEAYPAAIAFADGLFVHLLRHLDQAKAVQSLKMYLFAHSAWRQGLVAIATGGTGHSCALLRNALEAGLYGFLFDRDAEMAAHWKNRETDKKAQEAFRGSRAKDGGAALARKILRDEDPRLADSFRLVEEQLISFGGHPNFMAVESGVDFDIEDGAERGRLVLSYLRSDEDRVVAWQFAAATADTVLRLFCTVFETRANLALMSERLDYLGRLRLALIAEIKAIALAKAAAASE